MNIYVLDGHAEVGDVQQAGFGHTIGMLVPQTCAHERERLVSHDNEGVEIFPQQAIEAFSGVEVEQHTPSTPPLLGWKEAWGETGDEDHHVLAWGWEERKNAFSYNPYRSRAKFLNSPYQKFKGSDILY